MWIRTSLLVHSSPDSAPASRGGISSTNLVSRAEAASNRSASVRSSLGRVRSNATDSWRNTLRSSSVKPVLSILIARALLGSALLGPRAERTGATREPKRRLPCWNRMARKGNARYDNVCYLMSQPELSGTAGSPRGPRRRRAPKGEGHRLRGEIIAAASDLLADLGDPNQLSMRAVAAASGVTTPSIYRNFADKQALLVAVLETRWAELVRVIVEAASEVDDPFESLRRMGHAYVRFAEDHPGHYQVLFRTAAPAGITAG